jgi:hypothetical protein
MPDRKGFKLSALEEFFSELSTDWYYFAEFKAGSDFLEDYKVVIWYWIAIRCVED